MNKSVSFSFDKLEDKEDFKEYAKVRGLTLSQFAKFACYQYRERYPGIKRRGTKNKSKENMVFCY